MAEQDYTYTFLYMTQAHRSRGHFLIRGKHTQQMPGHIREYSAGPEPPATNLRVLAGSITQR